MKTLETIRVVIDATIGPFKAKMNGVKKITEDSTKAVDAAMSKNASSLDKMNTPVQKATDSIRKINQQIKQFGNEAGLQAGIKKYSDEYVECSEKIKEAERRLESLKRKQEEMPVSARTEISQEYKDLCSEAKKAEKALEKLNAEKLKMEYSGKAFTDDEGYSQMNAYYKEVQKQLDGLLAKQKEYDETGFSQSDSGAYRSLIEQIKSARIELSMLQRELNDWPDSGKVPTEGYARLEESIKDVEGRLNGFLAKRQEMESSGSNLADSQAWKRLGEQIDQTSSKLQYNKELQESMRNSGSYVTNAGAGFSSGNSIQSTIATAKAGIAALGPVMKQFRAQIVATVQRIPVIGKVITESAYLAKKGFSMISFAAKKIASGITRAGGAAASMIQKFASGIPVLRRFSGAANRAAHQGGILRRALSTLAMTARFMAASFLIMGTINGVKEGMQNLSRYSGSTNQSISLLISQLNQLKNALATAFAPILDAVTPILSRLIDWVLMAVNALAQFFAALTGKSSYTVAKRVATDYAGSLDKTSGSLDKTAGSADKANEANEKLKRTLMGFDEINKLNDDTDSPGSNGGGGGSGAGGGVDVGNMFATETIDSQFADFANMVKEAWENADFTEIGEILGEKLNDALENIPWDKIKETSKKIAKSIATFLNGFIDATDWGLVGATFGEGLNTVIEFGYTFVTTFNWDKFGSAIADAINGFFDTVEWDKLGKTLSDGFKGIFSTINTALEETDWEAIGADIGEFLANIDWIGCLTAVGEAIINALIAVVKLAEGLLKSILEGLQNVDWGEVAEEAWELAKKAWELLDLILSIAVSLFKEGWSSLKDFVGDKIEAGISLIKKGWSSLKDFVGDKIEAGLSLVKKGWKSLKDFVGEKVTAGISLAKKGWSSLKSFVGEKVTAGIHLAKKGWSSISSYVGTKVTTGIHLAKKGWSKISNYVGTRVTVGISLMKKGWSSIKKWVGVAKDFVLGFKLPKIGVRWGSKEVLGFKISFPNGFYTYAKGGFPQQGEMFLANEAGPEMIGRMGRKTTVANSQQITAGIASAVEPAVYKGVMAALKYYGGTTNGGNTTVVLQGDAKRLFKIIRDEAISYWKTHGTAPFPA